MSTFALVKRAAIAALLLPAGNAVLAQTQLRTLKGVAIQEPAGLQDFVRDRKALVALGKILFWDTQTGSDGMTACATCHFHAGADHRPQNQISDSSATFRVNLDLSALAFPLRALSDPGNKNSTALRDSSMRIGSMGTFRRIFDGIVPGQAAESGHDELDKPEFVHGDLQVRRVTARNTPSIFNTVYYSRGFWDGRAARTFNGFTVSGLSSEAPGVLVSVDGVLVRQPVNLDPANLASQGVGPILDHLEMSYAGRTWIDLARKLLSLAPLGLQRVSPTDSVLGDMARADGPGLVDEITYASLIQKAFPPKLWESSETVDEATQIEHNFPLFWGLAMHAYQATLNSDDSPFDRFNEGDSAALTAQQQEGLRLFQTTGNCDECHNGPEFSAAAMNPNRGNRAHAFDRTGVRPAAEDLGAGNATFKSISLRNVEFTGPYFHNGGQATLEQVVDFYRRAGDFAPVANDLRPFSISNAQRDSMVAFLKALSDDRVRYERAPFDHPELCVPVGHVENESGVLSARESAEFPTSAAEKYRLIPAVGAGGNSVPLRTFEEMLAGIGVNGERAHSLTQACQPGGSSAR